MPAGARSETASRGRQREQEDGEPWRGRQAIEKRRRRAGGWRKAIAAKRNGGAGGPISANASGERCARTTAPTATPGRISRTTTRGAVPTAGARTASPASATTSSACAWRSRCGTSAIRSSRSGCSDCPGPRAITARTSRSCTTTSTPRRRTPTSRCSTSIRTPPFPTSGCATRTRPTTSCEPEFELIDTGLFDEDRYFDVFVEYAKASPDDMVMVVTAHNRGPDAAPLHVLPTLWFRNTWSWTGDARQARHRRCRRRRPRGRPRRIGHVQALLRRRARASVLRQRNQRVASSTAPTAVRRAISRTVSTISSSRATRRR